MHIVNFDNGQIEDRPEFRKYRSENTGPSASTGERLVKEVFHKLTDYKVGRADTRSGYLDVDDRAKGKFRSDHGYSLMDLDKKGMPDQFHWKIEDGQVVDYYFMEVKTTTTMRESQLRWMKEHDQFERKVIFTRC